MIVDQDFMDQNWTLIVYNHYGKKIHHFCDDTSNTALEKIDDFEEYIKRKWINHRGSNNTYIRKEDGKKVRKSSIFDKDLVLQRVEKCIIATFIPKQTRINIFATVEFFVSGQQSCSLRKTRILLTRRMMWFRN